jgi:hypothetical protein
LSKLFQLAREAGLFQLTARVYYDILKTLPVTQDLVWFAPEAVRAFLAVGDVAATQIWFDVIEAAILDDEKTILIRDQLVPLARLSGQISNDDWNSIKIEKWWNAETRSDKMAINAELIYSRATLLYNLLEALGDKVPSDRWELLLDGPSRLTTVMPRSALWEILNQATEEVKRAETVLVALLVLGEAGPTQINPIVLRQVVVSLEKVGLKSEARSLALEAAIVGGI